MMAAISYNHVISHKFYITCKMLNLYDIIEKKWNKKKTFLKLKHLHSLINFSLLSIYEIKLKQPQGNSPLASHWPWALFTC